jgi:NAD(P)-dependent dehydrogenase (short-subunit alcohol dehydrogenase family)
MGQLEGKVAVVTGGANGIGRACCEVFASEGADIVIGDIAEELATETASLVEKRGRRAEFVHTNAASKADNDALIAAAVAQFGRVDVLVTAAGVPHSRYKTGAGEREPIGLLTPEATAALFCDMAPAEWQAVLDINLNGTLYAVQAAARQMVKQGAGAIVTIASIAAKIPLAPTPSYSVSKAAVWMLTKHAALTLGPLGVRVNAIGPGYIETSMTAQLQDSAASLKAIEGQASLGRMGKPEEIANTALFLASEQSSFFNGQLLHPDGGVFTG